MWTCLVLEKRVHDDVFLVQNKDLDFAVSAHFSHTRRADLDERRRLRLLARVAQRHVRVASFRRLELLEHGIVVEVGHDQKDTGHDRLVVARARAPIQFACADLRR